MKVIIDKNFIAKRMKDLKKVLRVERYLTLLLISFSSVDLRFLFFDLPRVCSRVGTGKSLRPLICPSSAGVFVSTSCWRDFKTSSSSSTLARTRSLVSFQDSGMKSDVSTVPVVRLRLRKMFVRTQKD